MKGISDIRDLLTKAEKEGLTPREWSDLMPEMGKTEIRGEMTDRILGLNPFPREKFVSITLGLNSQEKFTAEILRIAHGPAETVRQVVPSVFRRDSYSFQNHFDDEFFETENIYRHSYERKSLPGLKPEAANALKELSRDPSLKIRFLFMPQFYQMPGRQISTQLIVGSKIIGLKPSHLTVYD